LLRLVAQPGKDESSSVSLEGLAEEHKQVFPFSPPVYPDNATALAALAELVRKTPPWPARFQ
jgi:hypothetical protein